VISRFELEVAATRGHEIEEGFRRRIWHAATFYALRTVG
jgi:hypothetical protein